MKQRSHSGTETVIAPALAVVAMIAAVPARAQVPPVDSALAETLFREGKRLMAAHAYAEACPKIAESERVDPGGGTLLTLALCHEGEGKTASAWSEFNDALAIALKDGRSDRAVIARNHAAALEPKLSRLAIKVSSAAAKIQGLRVRRDGMDQAPVSWGVAVPVNAGGHEIDASAEGKLPWRTRVAVAANGALVEVEIPVLEDAPAPPAPAAAPPAPPLPAGRPPALAPRGPDARAIAVYVTGCVGVAGIVVGAITGVRAISLQSSASSVCPTTACNDMNAVRDNRAAATSADVSTASFAIGGAAAVASIVLLFMPRGSAHALSFVPSLAPGLAGASLRGRF